MRPLLNITRLGLVVSFSLICAPQPIHGQEATPALNIAKKFDEYGRIGGCDHSARLDNLAITLQNDPGSDAYVVVYGPDGEGWGTRKGLFDVIRDYLVNSRGLPEKRINLVHGGRNSDLKEPKVELWIVPHGASPPEPRHYETDIATFKGEFAEYQAWDGGSVLEYEDAGTGPPIGNVTQASFADMLQQQKQTVVYIVAFNGAEAVPGAWRRVATREVDSLKERGVNSNRLKVVFGGNDKETRVQLWILPDNAPPPVKDAGPEALPQRAVQIGSFSDYTLGEEDNQKLVFKEFLEVLRLNEKLRACVIVRLEAPGSSEEDDDKGAVSPGEEQEADESVKTESPKADFPMLIEKWKSELATLHKIPPERFIVLFVRAREWEGNTLETWIVPAGVLLPDPFAEEPEGQPEDSNKPSPAKPSK